MALDEVEVANLALSRLGRYQISTLSDSTPEAYHANLHIAYTRNSVLEDFDWGFARCTEDLTIQEDSATDDAEVDGWTYVYEWPTLCLKPIKIYNSSNDSIIDFEVRSWIDTTDSNKQYRVICTDQEDAVLVYTAQITDEQLYSQIFLQALVLKLAADLCHPLKADFTLKQQLMQEYSMILARAALSDANIGTRPQDTTCDFLDAR